MSAKERKRIRDEKRRFRQKTVKNWWRSWNREK